MRRIKLGKTGIEVSILGFGTGTAHPLGGCAQARMDRRELADLLLFAHEQGINFWDTAHQYETYPHIREALRQVRRSEIILSTKLNTSKRDDTLRDFHYTLRALGVEYIDICLVHGVRTEGEFNRRYGALETMLELKRQGKIRAVGISSHGIGALRAVAGAPEVELLWVRINHAGLCMDTSRLCLYERLTSLDLVRRYAKTILPKKLIAMARPTPESQRVGDDEYGMVIDVLEKIHSQSKGIVGMKVLAEGKLSGQAREAIEFVASRPFIDAMVIGMVNRDEVTTNSRIINAIRP
jgi:predicted aldo/keto reductase-like oxidoreductase